jgi:hypothetical protein
MSDEIPSKPLAPACWHLPRLSGTREGVTKAISAAKDVPDYAKAFLLSVIGGIDPAFNCVSLHAFVHVERGVMNFDMTIIPSTQLV